jgi:hypothetical protein
VAGGTNEPGCAERNVELRLEGASLDLPCDRDVAESRLDGGASPVDPDRGPRCEANANVTGARADGRKSRHVAVYPVDHRPVRVVVEREHVAFAIGGAGHWRHGPGMDRAIGTDGIPALPYRCGPLPDLVQPGRRLGAKQHPVGLVELSGRGQRREHEWCAKEPRGDPTAYVIDQLGERVADRTPFAWWCDLQLECDCAPRLCYECIGATSAPTWRLEQVDSADQ